MTTLRARAGLVIGAFALLLDAGCGGAGDSGGLGIRLRFLEAEPELLLQGDRSAPLVEVFYRELSLVLSESGQNVAPAEIELAAASGTVDRVGVVVEMPDIGPSRPPGLVLSWAGPGEDLTEDRSVPSRRSRVWGQGKRRYVFDLSAHPEWSGDITRFGLELTAPAGGSARIISVVGLARNRSDGPWFANRVQSRVILDWRNIETSPEEAWIGKILERPTDDGTEGREVFFTKRVDLEARYFADFEVVLEGLELTGWRRPLHLLWSEPGQDFSISRRLTASLRGDATSDGRARYRFHTRGHEAWRGRIGEFRLVFGVDSTEAVRIGRFTGFADRPSHRDLERAAREGFLVTLDDERRMALPGAPGLPIERTLEIAPGSVLRFAIGAPVDVALPVRFEVLASRGGAASGVIFERQLTEVGETGRWHEEAVDLGGLTGGTTRLTLRTTLELPAGSVAIPAWAEPEVLGPLEAEAPPNVLVVVVDTLRADRLSLYGHDRPTSPHLDAWAEERATVFTSTVAPAPWTLPSHLSLFSGIDSIRFGKPAAAPAGVPLLAGLLRRAGYLTTAVTGGGYLHPDFGFARGFDRFRYYSGTRAEDGGVDPPDEDPELERGVEHALALLERERDRPFFLFFHTYEAHMPFLPREPFYSRFSDLPPTPVTSLGSESKTEENGFMRRMGLPADLPVGLDPTELLGDLYDSGVAYTDLHLARLLTGLEEMGLAENTVVVVTSDHGELFGEHGLTAHTSLYDENLLVPLLISEPKGRGAGSTVDRQVRLVDVLPTILELVGLPAPGNVDGVSLLPLMEGGPANVPETAWSYASSSNFGVSIREANRWKYTFNNTAWPAVHGSEELIRVDGGASGRGAVETSDTLERFRRLAKERLEREAPGLRVILTNDAAMGLRVTLAGPLLSTNSVKSSETGCPCPVWEDGRVGVDLPAGASTSLRLEAERPAPLGLMVKEVGDGGSRFVVSLEPDEVGQGVRFELANGTWTRLAAEAEPAESASRIELTWQAGTVATTASDPELDQALARRLEALGYIH